MLRNMLKQNVLLFVMLISALSLSAQKIEWGTRNEACSKWYNPTVLMEDGESVYTAHLDDDNLVIERRFYVEPRVLPRPTMPKFFDHPF